MYAIRSYYDIDIRRKQIDLHTFEFINILYYLIGIVFLQCQDRCHKLCRIVTLEERCIESDQGIGC